MNLRALAPRERYSMEMVIIERGKYLGSVNGSWSVEQLATLAGFDRRLTYLLVKEMQRKGLLRVAAKQRNNLNLYAVAEGVDRPVAPLKKPRGYVDDFGDMMTPRTCVYPHPKAPWPASTRIPEALEAWALQEVCPARYEAALLSGLLGSREAP